MAKAGEIQKGKYGQYFHPNIPVTPVTLSQPPKNGSGNRALDGKSDSVTGVTGGSQPPDYLGPPGDDPADFLGDIPDFLRRV
jgi:hypothetical protein